MRGRKDEERECDNDFIISLISSIEILAFVIFLFADLSLLLIYKMY